MALIEMSVWPNMTLWNSTFSSLAMSCGRMVYIPVHNLLHKQLAYIQNMLYLPLFCARNYDNGCRSMRRYSHLIHFVIVNVHASNTFSGISTLSVTSSHSFLSTTILSIPVHYKENQGRSRSIGNTQRGVLFSKAAFSYGEYVFLQGQWKC